MDSSLKSAVKNELLAGLFGWIWLLSIPATIYFLIFAIWYEESWWAVAGSIIIGGFCKNLARSTNKIRDSDMDEHAFNVVADFGNVMEKLDCTMQFHDINKLPYTKEKITNSLLYVYGAIDDDQQKESIKIALTCLPHFQPDIGDEAIAGMPDFSNVELGDDDAVEALAAQITGDTDTRAKWQELLKIAEKESAELLGKLTD